MTQTSLLESNGSGLSEVGLSIKDVLGLLYIGVCIVDPDTHRIIFANSTALDMMNRNEAEVVGNVCHKLMCPAEVGKCPITDLGRAVDNSEKVLLCKNNELRPIQKTVSKVSIGSKKYLLESFFDITELKEKERLQGVLELANTVAHHLNQALQVLVLDINALKKRRSEEEASEILGSMHNAVSSMSSKINKMMKITKYKTEQYSEGSTIIDLE